MCCESICWTLTPATLHHVTENMTGLMLSFSNIQFDCMKQMVPQSKCALTDVQCLCTNTELTAEIEGCVLHHCTIVEGLQAKNITMNMCGAPVRDKHIQPLVIAITGGTLATLCFVMRICATLSRSSGRSLGVDDLMAGAAVLFAGPPTLLAIPCMSRPGGSTTSRDCEREKENILTVTA